MQISKFLTFITAIAFLVSFNSCKPDEGNASATIKLNPTWGNIPFSINPLYTNAVGDSLRFSKMKLYISEIKLIKDNGDKVPIKDIVLFNMTSDDPILLSTTSSKFQGGDYSGICFNFGITEAQNNTVPSSVSYPNPLCSDYDMYWGQTLKYTYVKIEGNVKTNGSNIFNVFIYHVGLFENFRTFCLQKPLVISDNTNNELIINLDLKELFDGSDPLNMTTDNATQTTDNYPLASRFANKITTAFSIE
jgi:hypothetical protein